MEKARLQEPRGQHPSAIEEGWLGPDGPACAQIDGLPTGPDLEGEGDGEGQQRHRMTNVG